MGRKPKAEEQQETGAKLDSRLFLALPTFHQQTHGQNEVGA
jgi:hypothetical protein